MIFYSSLRQHQKFDCKFNLKKISENDQKLHIFSEIQKFSILVNQNLDVFSTGNVFSDFLEISEQYFWSFNWISQKMSLIHVWMIFCTQISKYFRCICGMSRAEKIFLFPIEAVRTAVKQKNTLHNFTSISKCSFCLLLSDCVCWSYVF